MLKEYVKASVPEKDELKKELAQEREQLEKLPMLVKEAKLPVIVMFEGWGAAGKGSVLGKVIRNIDPRFFEVAVMDAPPTTEEKRYPFLHRYIRKIPEAGRFEFFDTCWMEAAVKGHLDGELSDAAYEQRVESIRIAERSLRDNGYLIIRFFFHIGRKEQKKRLSKLIGDKNTTWRVDNADVWQNAHYDEYLEAYDKYMEETNVSDSMWHIVDAEDKKICELQVLKTLNQEILKALAKTDHTAPVPENRYRLVTMPLLKDVDLYNGTSLTDEEYDVELKKLQKKLAKLHNELYRRKIPVVIAYEGWDAAGKGGNIKRITGALDPRGYVVQPIASPEPHEKARHFLWRFWTRLPKTGHIAIFDRTWYGRVMVERLEGFCTENDWQRAFNEMNEFEKELTDSGMVVIKFWVHIDNKTQLDRFTDRQNTPEKQWKITDEDWRNRDKWDLYEGAINDMIQKTSTEFAPWYILESVDKKYARIKALKIVIARLEEAFKKQDEN